MSDKFKQALALSSVPGSTVLTNWRAQHGPEATRSVQAMNDSRNGASALDIASILGGGSISSAGPVVNESTAMKMSAVYACVALIAGAISTLPLLVFERTPYGRSPVDHDYLTLFNTEPDPDISAAVFWEYLITALLFYGDFFAEIVRPSFRSNKVVALRAHHPLRVEPFRTASGELFYRVQPYVGASYVLHPADMLHVPSLGFDGLRSPSPITYAAKQSIGTALAAGEYSARFFSNGARPDFALTTPGKLTEDAAQLLRTTWSERHSGVINSHLPAVLSGGLDVKQLTLSAVDAQILQTSHFNLEEVCRILGVPPFMVGSTEKSTSWGTGQENMGRGFVKYTLLRILRKIEQEATRKMFDRPFRQFVAFDVSGIEAGDLKSENEALRIAIGRSGEPGWMTVNEARQKKGLPPKDEGNALNTGIVGTKSSDPKPSENDPTTA